MPDNNPENPESTGLNPQSLRLGDVARILSASGPTPVTVEMIQADIDAGAPLNTNGTMNLVHYAAWIVKEMADGN
jgi:uncharacterized phosphosugar-binding protein